MRHVCCGRGRVSPAKRRYDGCDQRVTARPPPLFFCFPGRERVIRGLLFGAVAHSEEKGEEWRPHAPRTSSPQTRNTSEMLTGLSTTRIIPSWSRRQSLRNTLRRRLRPPTTGSLSTAAAFNAAPRVRRGVAGSKAPSPTVRSRRSSPARCAER